jgi:hypothetical protein
LLNIYFRAFDPNFSHKGLERLLGDNPGLATARIVDDNGAARRLLLIATDWPGHFPNGPKAIAAPVAAGSDENARVTHQTNHNLSRL